MKKLLSLILILIVGNLTAFTQVPSKEIVKAAPAQDAVKVYTLKFTEQDLMQLFGCLEMARTYLPTSQAPALSVTQTLNNIAEQEKLISKQYSDQTQPAKKP